MAQVAGAYKVNVNRLFHWRKLYQRGRLAKQETRTMSLLPVRGQKVCKPDISSTGWLSQTEH